jgi:hypothetical protein
MHSRSAALKGGLFVSMVQGAAPLLAKDPMILRFLIGVFSVNNIRSRDGRGSAFVWE